MIHVVLSAVLLVHLLAAGPADAYQAESKRYYDAVARICQTGVTSEINTLYEAAQRADDTARKAGTRDANNFAGIKSPESAYLDCFQSPGDGKQ
jgi:hypothetical protein